MCWNPSNPTQFALGSEDNDRPVIQLWDVRQAQQPYQTIQGQTKGITTLEWSRVDERIILAGDKGGFTNMFNVAEGTVIGAIPKQPGYCISARFNKRHPDLVTVGSIEGGTQIYNIMGEPRHGLKNFKDPEKIR